MIERVLDDIVQRDVPIGPMTTYRVGGRARWFAAVDDDDGLARVGEAVRRSAIDVLVIGKGSNLLVADGGFDGLVVQLGPRFADVAIDGVQVRAGGAASLPVVARRTAAAGLTGFEWAVGVPGSIGGAVRMNAGGHGSDMASSLSRVRVVDLANGEDVVVEASGLELAYRGSALSASQVVAWAELGLAPGDPKSAEAEISEIVRWRRANQPGGQNAGSVFTNPEGDSAGRLIDTAGAKGLRLGTAQVSTRHANFIQADEGGSADDVWQLMREVRTRVHAQHGIVLHPETRLVGFAPMEDPT